MSFYLRYQGLVHFQRWVTRLVSLQIHLSWCWRLKICCIISRRLVNCSYACTYIGVWKWVSISSEFIREVADCLGFMAKECNSGNFKITGWSNQGLVQNLMMDHCLPCTEHFLWSLKAASCVLSTNLMLPFYHQVTYDSSMFPKSTFPIADCLYLKIIEVLHEQCFIVRLHIQNPKDHLVSLADKLVSMQFGQVQYPLFQISPEKVPQIFVDMFCDCNKEH